MAISGPTNSAGGNITLSFPAAAMPVLGTPEIRAYRNGSYLQTYSLTATDTSKTIQVAQTGSWRFDHYDAGWTCDPSSCVEPDIQLVFQDDHTVTVTLPSAPTIEATPEPALEGHFTISVDPVAGATNYHFAQTSPILETVDKSPLDASVQFQGAEGRCVFRA